MGLKGLLLAGGRGTRLRPLTFSGNKHLLPIANKPMLFYGLEHLRNAGVKDIAVVTGPVKEGIVETLGDGSRFGVRITYIEQPEPKGLAHAVLMAKDFISDEPFVMYLGDNLLKEGVGGFIRTFVEKKANCVVGVFKVANASRFGVVELIGGKIVRVVEKPKKPKSDLALIGVYVFDKTVFEAIERLRPSKRGELEITDAIQLLIDDRKAVEPKLVGGWWKDTGMPDDLLEANRLVLADLRPNMQGRLSRRASCSGSVDIGQGTVIIGNVSLVGPVIVGTGCKIGPNVYVGPYTSIGDECVLKNMEVENSMIMKGCSIESSKRIVHSIIGSYSAIENGDGNLHGGHKLVVGERSFARI
jgi:glucose-1-phosphate thymidylyltransferase